MSNTDRQRLLKEALFKMDPCKREYWCHSKNGCACMGCANRSLLEQGFTESEFRHYLLKERAKRNNINVGDTIKFPYASYTVLEIVEDGFICSNSGWAGNNTITTRDLQREVWDLIPKKN